MSERRPVRRALLAVYDKTGVVEFARGLSDLGVELVSSGGTAATLLDAGVPVTPVEDVTGFPEMLGGRVKTLHPAIHGGILADRRKPDHEAELREHRIEPIDLVVVNLYPFRETVASGAGPDEVVEQIDIGGPAMVRAAAKNFASVTVVVDPAAYGEILAEIADGGPTLERRRRLAADAFAHTAAYDAAVAGWFAAGGTGCPRSSVSRWGRPPISGTGRTRTSEARCSRRSRARGSSEEPRSSSRARTCRSTTGSTSTRRSRWRPTSTRSGRPP